MKNQPTMYLIWKTIKENNNASDMSAKGIAHNADIDATSENLRFIQEQCFDLVESGDLIANKVEGKNGGWFFGMVNA